jgi:hypothetical protein
VGPLTGYSAPSDPTPQTTRNEITLLAGASILDHGVRDEVALSIEYRRGLARYLDWTIGWLNEGPSVSRVGPIAQIWVGRSFFDDQPALGLGAGPDLGHDTRGDHSIRKMNRLVRDAVSYRFHPRWAVRATYDRVTTGNDRDADIIMGGNRLPILMAWNGSRFKKLWVESALLFMVACSDTGGNRRYTNSRVALRIDNNDNAT